MKKSAAATRPGKGRYVVAMVLGTALSALGAAPGGAAGLPEGTVRAVSDISRYCAACWRNARLSQDSWTDCTQEVFVRLLERVSPDAWCLVLKEECEERREFLRAIDAVKKRTLRSRKYASVYPDCAADRRDAGERLLAEEREAVEQAAEELLSGRQQRILQLSFEGWSVAEIARELETPVERVSDDKYKAIRKLRAYLAEREES